MPGWQITTGSRRLALAVARIVPGRTVRSHQKGEWQARLPEAVLTVTALGADVGVLRCRLSAQPRLSAFTLSFALWPTALVLRCPLTALPAQGQLSVRDVRLVTRMGRTVPGIHYALTPVCVCPICVQVGSMPLHRTRSGRVELFTVSKSLAPLSARDNFLDGRLSRARRAGAPAEARTKPGSRAEMR